MATPGGADDFTVGAETAGFKGVEQFNEVEVWVTLDGARIRQPDHQPEEECKTEQALAAVEKPLRLVAHSQHLVAGHFE